MQFVIVLTSVILFVAAIWLIGRRMRLTGSKSKTLAGFNTPEKLVDSLPVGDGARFAGDGVELGPVELVDWKLKSESETKIEKLSAETESEWQPAACAQSPPDSDVPISDEAQQAIEIQNTPEADSDNTQMDTKVGQDQAEAAEPDIRPEFPDIIDSGPHFGEYSKKYLESENTGEVTNGASRQTTLKLPESSLGTYTISQSDEVASNKPIQAELEISVVFPDYRGCSDREIDVICWLPGEADVVRRMDVLTIYHNSDLQLEPPHSIIGLDVDDGKWCNLEESDVMSKYSDLIFTMQLSYQGQHVTERDWWKFSTMVENIARALSRQFHLSMTTDTIIAEARLLNEQIWNLDLQAVLILKSDYGEQPFSKKSIEYLAREFNLEERRGTTIYDRYDTRISQSVPLFSIVPTDDENTVLAKELWKDADLRTMILFSNLACVRDPLYAFDTMFDVAKELEDRLAVRMIDQNHKAVNMHSRPLIRAKIEQFIDRMAEYGITPGSDVALRLFESSSIVSHWADSQGVVSLMPDK